MDFFFKEESEEYIPIEQMIHFLIFENSRYICNNNNQTKVISNPFQEKKPKTSNVQSHRYMYIACAFLIMYFLKYNHILQKRIPIMLTRAQSIIRHG